MWTREDTRDWIKCLKHRIDDINYFLNLTVEWCEDNYIYDHDRVFICSFITCIWVSYQRDEPITYNELLEMLGLDNMTIKEDKLYELDEDFVNLEHEQLLETVIRKFKGF